MKLAPLIKNKRPGLVLPEEFYFDQNVVKIARSLLGKVLVSNIDDQYTSGIIVETEAYSGQNDRASHAFGDRNTKRTSVMYQPGGRAYVYLIYGMYHLLNVVTNVEGKPDALLIRAIEPLDGIEHMLKRRKQQKLTPNLTNGPGKLTIALGINLEHYGVSLLGDTLFIEDRGINLKDEQITSGPRVGVEYAAEDALRPWRFWVKDNPFVSKVRGK